MQQPQPVLRPDLDRDAVRWQANKANRVKGKDKACAASNSVEKSRVVLLHSVQRAIVIAGFPLTKPIPCFSSHNARETEQIPRR